MWQYWSHFKYTVAHKWYVFLECVKMGIFWRGVFHDLSKFTPSEFCQYANYFFDTDGSRFSVHDDYVRTIEFERAWFHHDPSGRKPLTLVKGGMPSFLPTDNLIIH